MDSSQECRIVYNVLANTADSDLNETILKD